MLAGWKTLVFNLATVVMGVLTATDFTQVISNPKIAGWVVAGIGVANMLLRAVTTTPILSSTPKP